MATAAAEALRSVCSGSTSPRPRWRSDTRKTTYDLSNRDNRPSPVVLQLQDYRTPAAIPCTFQAWAVLATRPLTSWPFHSCLQRTPSTERQYVSLGLLKLSHIKHGKYILAAWWIENDRLTWSISILVDTQSLRENIFILDRNVDSKKRHTS